MDRSWIVHGRQFTQEYNQGLRQFVSFVKVNEGPDNAGHGNGNADADSAYMHRNDDNEAEEDGPDKLLEEFQLAGDEENKERPDNLFEKLLAEAKCLLYPGSKENRFEFVLKLLHHKSYHGITNTAFDDWMKLFAEALPEHNTLPRSYREAKAYLKELGLSYDSIHVCPNNCMLFWRDRNKYDNCLKCGASRWKHPERKSGALKVLRHFPLVPRLKRMFSSKIMAENMQWHKLKRRPIPDVSSHPADGKAWEEFEDLFEGFAADPRNVRLGLATDGFNPYGTMSNTYSMWPVFAVPYNLAPWDCVDASNFMLCLLIPGKTSPGKDFDVFIEPLVTDLEELWEGVRTYDAFGDEMFDLHAAVLWCTHDYPACSTMSGRTTKGYAACLHCDKNPLSKSVKSKVYCSEGEGDLAETDDE